jgi:glucokinase
VILDGKPWNGRATAGEIGHMVVRINGAPVRLAAAAAAWRPTPAAARWRRGRAGASSRATRPCCSRSWRSAAATGCPAGIWERALARDDQLALELLEEAVAALGAGIASAVNLLDPEAVVIGGGLGIRMGDPWVKKIRKAMLPHLFVDDDPPPSCWPSWATSAARTAGRCSRPARAATDRPAPRAGSSASRRKRPVARSGPASAPMPVSERTSSSS